MGIEVSHEKLPSPQLLYTILVDETLSGLVQGVNAAMVDGWRCVGGPFESLTEDGLCQAMQRDLSYDQALRLMEQAAKQLGLFGLITGVPQ